MSPVAALAMWAQIGAAMAEADPAGFVAIVEAAAERAGLHPQARRQPGKPELRVLEGGRGARSRARTTSSE